MWGGGGGGGCNPTLPPAWGWGAPSKLTPACRCACAHTPRTRSQGARTQRRWARKQRRWAHTRSAHAQTGNPRSWGDGVPHGGAIHAVTTHAPRWLANSRRAPPPGSPRTSSTYHRRQVHDAGGRARGQGGHQEVGLRADAARHGSAHSHGHSAWRAACAGAARKAATSPCVRGGGRRGRGARPCSRNAPARNAPGGWWRTAFQGRRR